MREIPVPGLEKIIGAWWWGGSLLEGTEMGVVGRVKSGYGKWAPNVGGLAHMVERSLSM